MTASSFAGRGRYSIYTGRSTNWSLIVLSAVLALPLFLLGAMSEASWLGLVVPLLAAAGALLVNALTGSSVRTTAGPNGVTVHFGLIGWPRCTYRLDQIARAEVIDLQPWSVAFGFWWTLHRTCCTVRPGPTLRLTLHTGRTVTITVPDADAAVAALRQAQATAG